MYLTMPSRGAAVPTQAILTVTWDVGDSVPFYPECRLAKKRPAIPADLAALAERPPAKRRRPPTGGITASVGPGKFVLSAIQLGSGSGARVAPPAHAPPLLVPPVLVLPDMFSDDSASGTEAPTDDDEPHLWPLAERASRLEPEPPVPAPPASPEPPVAAPPSPPSPARAARASSSSAAPAAGASSSSDAPPPPVPHAVSRDRERRAGTDGWPFIELVSDPKPTLGYSKMRRSVNNKGVWDFRAYCGWCGKTCSRTTAEYQGGARHATSLRQMGQGRPLGLLWAWILESHTNQGRTCGLAGHAHGKFLPEFPARLHGRGELFLQAGSSAFFDEERPPRVPVADSRPTSSHLRLAEPYALP